MAFFPSTKTELQTAVDAWVSDETSAIATYGVISAWNTSEITDMSDLFRNKPNFNGNIINWDVSKVTDMHRMFSGAHSFNQPIGNWNTSEVTNMYYMFRDARTFNKDINNWDVSKVTNMWSMFGGAYVFNQSLNDWVVSNVTNMGYMFYNAKKFNGLIRNWNVSNVQYMDYMFQGATVFNNQLDIWNVGNVVNMKGMFYYAEAFNQDISGWNTENVTTFRRMFSFDPVFDQPIDNWNTSKVTDMHAMFYPLSVFNQSIGNWDTSKVTDMTYMFNGASSFNKYIRGWDTATTPTNLSYMFTGANAMHNAYTGTPGFSNSPTNEFFNQPYNSNASNSQPNANADVATTMESNLVNINILGNDTDADGDPLTVYSVSANNGTVVIQGDQTIVYTPISGFVGIDTITYNISDGKGGNATSTVTVTVEEQENRAPIANVDTAETNENTPTMINVIVNDTDADGDTLIVESASADQGSVVIESNQNIQYTPKTDWIGQDTIYYTINDGALSSISTVAVNVLEQPNAAPTANVDTATTNKNTSVVIGPLINDTDPEGDDLIIYMATAINGTVSIQSGSKTILYTPNNNFIGTDTITYSINDGNSNIAQSTISVFVNRPPVANVDEIITNQNTNITIDVTNNDTDADGDTLIVTSASATHGTVVIQNQKNIHYTPANDYVGSDTISYTISDGRTGTANSIVEIIVNAQPTANVDIITTQKNQNIIINSLSNDVDADGDTIVITSATAINGTVAIQSDGKLFYSPTTDYTGTDTITYVISDGKGGTGASYVNITVNAPPVANTDNIITNQNTSVEINVINNDTDIDGETLTVSSTTAINGTVTILSNGNINYTPFTNYAGADTITYVVDDEDGGSSTSTVIVTVNTQPVANPDERVTNKNTSLIIDVLTNDTDEDEDTIVISTASALNGTATIDNEKIIYIPAPNFTGADTASYTISDGKGGSSSSIITISVNDPPVANPDNITTNKNTSTEINVLINDTDSYGGTPIVSSATATYGTIEILSNGNINYTPPLDFLGTDIITYFISDNQGGISSSTVTVNINTQPVANTDNALTQKNQSVIIGVLANDTDDDEDNLYISSASANIGTVEILSNESPEKLRYTPLTDYTGTTTIIYTITDRRGGTSTSNVNTTINAPPVTNLDNVITNKNTSIEINIVDNTTDPEGDVITVSSAIAIHGSVQIQENGHLLYTPNVGYIGSETITYSVTDAKGGITTSTLTVTVNDPPVATSDEITTNKNTSVIIDVTSNDTDTEGQTITVSSATAFHGSVQIQLNGTLLYTPKLDSIESDIITYTITDGNGSSASTVNVTIINPDSGNTAPIANADVKTTNINTSFEINVLENDVDADGDTLIVSSATANGTVEILSGGIIKYTPITDYTGLDTIVYTVIDNNGGISVSTVTVTIITPTTVNTNPVANIDEITTEKNTSVVINVIVNDTDADGDSLTVSSATATNGSVTVQSNGLLLYTPLDGFTGEDTINYTISDGRGGLAYSTVTVTINTPTADPPINVNIPPSVVNDIATTYYGNPITIDVLKNDSDPDGDTLSVSAATAQHGTVTINDNETIEYTPNVNFFGTDIISYTAIDGKGGETDGSVTLISEVCFTRDALVLTDQGYILIDQLDINKHTIHNQRIVAVTKTINKSPHLICVKKSALGENIPSQDTTMSKDHMLYYKDGKINANRLEELEPNVCKVENTKCILYNVLLESYSSMMVNNMMVETLHPDNIIAKMAIWNMSNQLHEFSNHTNTHD